MNIKERYSVAREEYERLGVNVDEAISILNRLQISMHCWQGDDVNGFEGEHLLSGGIQTTGNYFGKASNPEELMLDIDKALSLIPGKHRINLHASYAIFEDGQHIDRNAIQPVHFKKWIEFAKERGLGLDFNPTFFSHPLAQNATLSSENDTIRKFWIEHGIACIRICEYISNELNQPVNMNVWIPDGFKDTPIDRFGPRKRLKNSLDEVLGINYDKTKVIISLESKVFGIGLESYTVGSHEFYMNYASKNNLLCLLDNGHYHPTESVADKISSMLLFSDKVALHITRSVRWDSDHVVRLDDETKEIAKEIVLNGIDHVILALDYFDASINRVAAWVIGMRNMQKAILEALLLPKEMLINLQNKRELTELLVLQEELKLYPFGDVWNYFCETNGVISNEKWFDSIKEYENNVLSYRKKDNYESARI